MSHLTAEMIPIIFMYFCVFMLAPFIAFALWMMADGDAAHEAEMQTAADVTGADVAPTEVDTTRTVRAPEQLRSELRTA